MSRPVFTNNGNLALNNLALLNHVRDLDFKEILKPYINKKNGSKTVLTTILMILVSYRNNVTGQCNPDMRTIAKKAGCSRDTVIRSMKVLFNSDELFKIKLRGVGTRETTHYYFTYDMPDLIDMFNDESHELHKTSQVEYIEEAIYYYQNMY